MNEKKEEAELGAGGLQRSAQGKAALIKKINSIRQGFETGGYCDTEKLKVEEQKLHGIIAEEIKQAEAKGGSESVIAVFRLNKQLAGLCYKPKLVVAADQTL